MRRRHPDKEIESVLQFAELNGWRVIPGGSHAWGRMYCPSRSEACRCGAFCITSIWSTPRNAGGHSRFLRRVVLNCSFGHSVEDGTSRDTEATMEYQFTLHFRLAHAVELNDADLDRLFEAGCDDANVGLGNPGHVALAFCRKADTASEALEIATSQVLSALLNAELTEAAPDLGGLSDVAELVEVSRQNLRKLMLNHPADFPAPTHAGSTLLWNMAEVLYWLEQRAGYSLAPGLLETTRATWATNTAIHRVRMRRLQRAAR
jgi:predicted DNA-binding transcriptional regulator AlpA